MGQRLQRPYLSYVYLNFALGWSWASRRFKEFTKNVQHLWLQRSYHYTNHWYLMVSAVATISVYAYIISFECFVYCSVEVIDYQQGGESGQCVISLCWKGVRFVMRGEDRETSRSGVLEKNMKLWFIKLWYLKSCGFLFLNLVGVKVGKQIQ